MDILHICLHAVALWRTTNQCKYLRISHPQEPIFAPREWHRPQENACGSKLSGSLTLTLIVFCGSKDKIYMTNLEYKCFTSSIFLFYVPGSCGHLSLQSLIYLG